MVNLSTEKYLELVNSKFNGLETPEDIKAFLDSKILKTEYGEPLYKDRYPLYKNQPDGTIWWVDFYNEDLALVFSFNTRVFFSFYADYPQRLSKKQLQRFNKENPPLAWSEYV